MFWAFHHLKNVGLEIQKNLSFCGDRVTNLAIESLREMQDRACKEKAMVCTKIKKEMVKTGFSTDRLKWENILIKILNSRVIAMKVSELTRLSIKQTADRPRLGQNVTGKRRSWSAQVVLMFANVSKPAKYTGVVIMPRACCEVTPTFDYVNCWRSN